MVYRKWVRHSASNGIVGIEIGEILKTNQQIGFVSHIPPRLIVNPKSQKSAKSCSSFPSQGTIPMHPSKPGNHAYASFQPMHLRICPHQETTVMHFSKPGNHTAFSKPGDHACASSKPGNRTCASSQSRTPHICILPSQETFPTINFLKFCKCRRFLA